MTELALRSPVAGPTEAEAWTALLGHTEALDKVRHPKDLKDEMYAFLSRHWDMSESKLDFVDFGILWIDAHYRDLTTRMAITGPGRETFNIATYRILKTSRLEGYWDAKLEKIADWIDQFAAGKKSTVTITDFERLLDTMPASRDLTEYEANLTLLFWGETGPDSRRHPNPGFLSQFPAAAYEEAFNTLQKYPPGEGWELRELMYQVQHRGILCKGVMLHLGLWFNPFLEEPANRSNNKHPMFHHLKPSFSSYDTNHPLYEADEAWKDAALVLQRIVLDYTLEQWPKGSLVIGKLGTIQDMSEEVYADYISAPFWEGLIREVRKHTDVPFQHLALQKFNNNTRGVLATKTRPPAQSWTAVSRTSAVMDQVKSIIRDEYTDGTPGRSPAGDSAAEGNSNARRATGNPSIHRQGSGQSDRELDFIVVGENASTISGQPRKRKALAMKQESEEDSALSIQNKRRMPSTGTFDRQESQISTKPRRIASQRVSLPLSVQEDHIPMNTIVSSARAALASMHQLPYSEPKRSGFRAVSQVVPSQPLEESSFDSPTIEATPSRRLRKHTLTNPVDHHSSPPPPPPPAASQLQAQSIYQTPYQTPYESLQPSQPSRPTPDALPMTPQATESPAPQGNSKIEQAIMLLQEQYGDKLQIKELLAAIKLLKNEVDATIFLTLKPGRLRNAWLQNEIK